MRYLFLLLLAGCAASQSVTLLPRGDAQSGAGTLDRVRNILTVNIGGRHYEGPVITTTPSQASALLRGPAGQVRCDFGWDALMRHATGVCTDNAGASYDLQIAN